MSISTFQEKVFKGGCGPSVLIFCAAVMFGGMFYNCGRANGPGPGGQGQDKIALTVAGNPVPAAVVSTGIEARMGQFGAMAGQLPPSFEASTYGEALQSLIDTAAYVPLAQKNGVDLNDENLLKAFEYSFAETVDRAKAGMIAGGQLKPNGTQKDFDEAVKKQTGKTLAELKQQQLENVKSSLADPTKRQSAIISLASAAVKQKLAPQFTATDEQLKKSYENVTFKRILFKKDLPGKSADERADATLTELRGGGNFEAAIDKYSNDLPSGTQKVSAQTNSATGRSVLADPQFKPLAGLKAGQISGIVEVAEGKAIYKVVSVSSDLPKDFEEKKEQYRKELSQTLVDEEVKRQLEEIKKTGNLVTFNAPGLKAIYDYSLFTKANPGAVAGTESTDKVKALLAEAKAAVEKNEGYDSRAAALAQYVTLDTLYNAPGADKNALRKDRIKSVTDLLQSSESFTLRIDLVNLYVEDKNGDEAFNNLLLAAQSNSQPDTIGQQHFKDISDKLLALKQKGMVNAEQEKAILAEQTRWQKEKLEADKIQAEQKRLDDEAKKAAEKEKAAAEKAAKKPPVATTVPPAGKKP